MEKKRLNNSRNYIAPKVRPTDPKSKTIPDQALSPRVLQERFTRGQSVPMFDMTYDSDYDHSDGLSSSNTFNAWKRLNDAEKMEHVEQMKQETLETQSHLNQRKHNKRQQEIFDKQAQYFKEQTEKKPEEKIEE